MYVDISSYNVLDCNFILMSFKYQMHHMIMTLVATVTMYSYLSINFQYCIDENFKNHWASLLYK